MNLFKKKFIKVPHLSFSEAFKEGGRNPSVDWIMILTVSCIVTIILIIISICLYKRVSLGYIQNKAINNNQSEKVFDEKDLSLVMDRFNEKNNNRIQIRKGIGLGI